MSVRFDEDISINSLHLLGSLPTATLLPYTATGTVPTVDIGVCVTNLISSEKTWKGGRVFHRFESLVVKPVARKLQSQFSDTTITPLKGTDDSVLTINLTTTTTTTTTTAATIEADAANNSPQEKKKKRPHFHVRLLFFFSDDESIENYRLFPTMKNCSTGSNTSPSPNYNQNLTPLLPPTLTHGLTHQLLQQDWSSSSIPPPQLISDFNPADTATITTTRDLVALFKTFLAGYGLYSSAAGGRGLTGFELTSIVNYFVRSGRVKIPARNTIIDNEEEDNRRRGEAASTSFGNLLKEVGSGVNWLGERNFDDDFDGDGETSSDSDSSDSENDDENSSKDTFDASVAGGSYNKKRSSLNAKNILIMPLGFNTPQRMTLNDNELADMVSKSGGNVGRILKKWRRSAFGPVILSADLSRNFLFGVSREEIRRVAQVCRLGYHLLYSANASDGDDVASSDRLSDRFEEVFLGGGKRNLKYSGSGGLAGSDMLCKIVVDVATSTTSFDRDYSDLLTKSHVVENVLTRGLGDRVRSVRVLSSKINNAATGAKKRKKSISSPTKATITVALKINSNKSTKLVNRGPKPSEMKRADSFRSFWGPDIVQTRRFATGEIVLAVVWDSSSQPSPASSSSGVVGSTTSIIEKIARHLVARHVSNNAAISFPGSNVLETLVAPFESSTADDPLTLHKAAISAFENLSKIIKSPPSSSVKLPLPVVGCEGVAANLRYSAVFPILPNTLLGGGTPSPNRVLTDEPMDVNIVLESSNKWPKDLTAIAAAETAMLISLATILRSQQGITQVAVCSTHITLGYAGFPFRLSIRPDASIRLLTQRPNKTPLESDLLQRLDFTANRQFAHHNMMHGVLTAHNPVGSNLVRLATRWCDQHMLSGLFSPSVIELLVAHTLTNPAYNKPTSLLSCFLSFLSFVGGFEFATNPLIIDPTNSSISSSDVSKIHQFYALNKSSTGMWIVCSYDRTKGDSREGGNGDDRNEEDNEDDDDSNDTWGPSVSNNIEPAAVHRLQNLARISLTMLVEWLENGGEGDNWLAVFRETKSSLMGIYDVVFKVNTTILLDDQDSKTVASGNKAEKSKNVVSKEENPAMTSYSQSLKNRNRGLSASQKKASVYKNLSINDLVVVGFQPVDEAVRKLRGSFGANAIICYNRLSPEYIGVIWRGNGEEKFNVVTSGGKMPAGDIDIVVTNSEDVVNRMLQVAEGIIDKIMTEF